MGCEVKRSDPRPKQLIRTLVFTLITWKDLHHAGLWSGLLVALQHLVSVVTYLHFVLLHHKHQCILFERPPQCPIVDNCKEIDNWFSKYLKCWLLWTHLLLSPPAFRNQLCVVWFRYKCSRSVADLRFFSFFREHHRAKCLSYGGEFGRGRKQVLGCKRHLELNTAL